MKAASASTQGTIEYERLLLRECSQFLRWTVLLIGLSSLSHFRAAVDSVLQLRFPAYTSSLQDAFEKNAAHYKQEWTSDQVIDRLRRQFHIRLSEIWPDEKKRRSVVAELASNFGTLPPAQRAREIWRRFAKDLLVEKAELQRLSEDQLNHIWWSEDKLTDDVNLTNCFVDEDEDEVIDEYPSADLELWFSKDVWYPQEAAFLVNGLEPKRASITKSSSRFSALVDDALDSITRAIEKAVLVTPLSPSEVVAWASGRLQVPKDVSDFALMGSTVANTRETTADLEKAVEVLTSENRRLEAMKTEINPRTLGSYQRILLAVAIEKYRYRPGQSHDNTVSKIEGAAQNVGLKVSNNTIRKHLNEAQEALADEVSAYFAKRDVS